MKIRTWIEIDRCIWPSRAVENLSPCFTEKVQSLFHFRLLQKLALSNLKFNSQSPHDYKSPWVWVSLLGVFWTCTGSSASTGIDIILNMNLLRLLLSWIPESGILCWLPRCVLFRLRLIRGRYSSLDHDFWLFFQIFQWQIL